jgi:hypothetical protein
MRIMKTITPFSCALSLALLATAFAPECVSAAPTSSDTQPKRLKRADSFLGVHFDFHAGPDCTEIGKNTTREMIENIINLVGPDYLQIDCKGHRGLSSYPTKVGNPAPGFVGDPLRLWRQVTAERGVSLYLHYSGVWDSEAIIQHPDWGVINADGSTNDRATSFFSPYADQLLIPQLRELAGDYGVDGAWIDGECWAAAPDWSEPALKAFRDTTGITNIPRKPGDPHWHEFLDFNRELFRRYLRHYLGEVKQTHPQFELCSNWAYTDHMAEPVSAPLDFLSGDYSPDDSVNSARVSARYLARQGVAWDLMAWSFSLKARGQGESSQKTAVQLQREAAVVLALGGGFQAYFKQKRDGSVFDEQLPVMAEVAKFCRDRQALCHHAEAVPQVALLLSTAGHYRRINGLYPRDLGRLSGVLQALLESQYSVEVLGEHHLAGRMPEYPLIVVPEWEYLEAEFCSQLVAYVKAGGNLLLIGPRTAALFESVLGVTLSGEPKVESRHLAHHDTLTAVKGLMQDLECGAQTRAFGRLHTADNIESRSQPAAVITPMGRGRIAATSFDLGQDYAQGRSPGLRRFVNDLARELFPQPLVEVRGSTDVDVSLARNRGQLLVNLVNTGGPHQSAGIIEAIPPVGPLAVTIRQPTKPVQVNLEPGGRPLPFDYRDGAIHLALPRLEIHEIIVVRSN